jgi:hypothetical protein
MSLTSLWPAPRRRAVAAISRHWSSLPRSLDRDLVIASSSEDLEPTQQLNPDKEDQATQDARVEPNSANACNG